MKLIKKTHKLKKCKLIFSQMHKLALKNKAETFNKYFIIINSIFK